MGSLQLSSLSSSFSLNSNYITNTRKTLKPPKSLRFSGAKIRAVSTIPDSESEATISEEPPSVNFAFISSVLLPDGTPDVHLRTACGGQKLRNIMLDANIDLYGPYARPLLNCAGGGTCATCMVEVVEGKHLLTPRTDKEKEKLKRVAIQQLPEWKAHEWKYEKVDPSSESL